MGLLQRRVEVGNSAPAYTVGGGKTYLIIGLGNPGEEYDGTRHNLGFAALDSFAEKNDFPGWVLKRDLQCLETSMMMGPVKVILCKPLTFMNMSGQAAGALQRYYRVYNPETVVVHDELALPFGQIRARVGGESAGHNGIKSLIEHMGEDFGRLRVGISNEHSDKTDSDKFVLDKFNKAEQGEMGKILGEINAMLTEYIFGGELPHDTRSVL